MTKSPTESSELDKPALVDRCFYDILNVPPGCRDQDIREAYLHLKETYNDNNVALYSLINESEMKSSLAQLEIAYETLSTPQRRRVYDEQLLPATNFTTHTNSCQTLTPFPDEMSETLEPKRTVPSSLSSDLHETDQVNLNYAPRHNRRIHASIAKNPKFINDAKALVNSHEDCDGLLFRNLRERAHVSLEEMQEHIKVSQELLCSIEKNRFERLPQPVYVKGFLRSYISYLGIKDSDSLVEGYMKRLKHWATENCR